jgi:prophage regulatory protein
MSQLPQTGYLRLSQIIGKSKANPPIPAIIPIGKTSWWQGVRTGRFPKPIKLGPRTTVWRVEDILALVKQGAYGR